ncbi:MAG TPA: FKBP-type peptidyl-prolyl cis-trans isomerase [Bacteroidales bacterium]|nr:FKBP-type peptidyl-prolyl cis-trans isomerase [Bacteroidales bacterium]
MIRNLFYTFLFAFFIIACQNRKGENQSSPTDQQEALLRANKYLVQKDADAVKGYIRRHGWKMNQTQTGLWYEITQKGTGSKVETGKYVTIAYKLWLLDGTLCYSSESDGNKTFLVGKGGVEPGLEQGVLLMSQGDKARFIMLPHLAYGLIGDERKIPARATIVYEVQLIKISDQK